MGAVFEGRVLPVAFSCLTDEGIQKSQNILEHALIMTVRSGFPVESRPLLMMDRGYARVALLQKLRQEGIPFLVRAKGNVLVYFQGQARRIYRRFVSEGIRQGHRPELVGGGLIRSLGGWSAVKSLRRSGGKVLTDERILGTDDFVERVLGEVDHSAKRLFSSRLRDKEVLRLIEERCKKEGISVRELQMGSRRGVNAKIRSDFAWKLAREWGIPLAEIARHLGVSTSAISQILRRRLEL